MFFSYISLAMVKDYYISVIVNCCLALTLGSRQ